MAGTAALDGRVQPGDSRAVGTEVARFAAIRVATHARAFRELAGAPPPVERVAIIGGGLFPRTALILRELLPTACITIIDANRSNLDRARALLSPLDINFLNASYMTSDCGAYDLLVIPLSFDGDRSAIYARPRHPQFWCTTGSGESADRAVLFR